MIELNNESEDLKGRQADWSVRGFWDSHIPNEKNIKKSKYCQAAEAGRLSLTPTIASYEAIFDNEAKV